MVPVDPSSIVNLVSVSLRKSIVSGGLPAGQCFTVSELAAQLGVSHVPIREALRRLESEGLVDMLPTKGGRVRPMNRDDVLGLFRLRLKLEPRLAIESSSSLTADDRKRLEAILDRLHGRMIVGERLDVHRQFHLRLLRNAMSDWDFRIWNHVYTATERYAGLRFALEHEADADRRDHMPLLDAMKSGSESEVRTVTVEHIERNRHHILAMIDNVS